MKHKKVLGSTGLLLFYLGVFLVFIAPIVRLLFMSLKGSDGYGLSNYQVLLQEKRTREAIFNTILIAASSTMIAIVAGSGLALAAAYTNIKRKRLLELLVLLPFIIPSYIITLSWSGFLSKKGIVNQILGAVGIGPVNIYSIGGILLVIGICNIPVVYMSVIHMLRRIPRDLEWASRACGFGLSYTDFEINDYCLESLENKKMTVSVQVKNTGKVSGKEVVQVYTSLPGGILEKEAHRLVAYAKTSELKPDESEKITVEISLEHLTSYDEKRAAWILESGFYGIWIGNSLADAKLCGGVKLDNEVILRQVKNLFPLKQELDEKTQTSGKTSSREKEVEKLAAEQKLNVAQLYAADFTTEVIEYKKNGELCEKDALDFVNTLTEKELIDLAAGDPGKAQGGNLGAAGISVPGSAGETHRCAIDKGLASIVLADGPAGLRLMKYYHVNDGSIVTMPFEFSLEGGLFYDDSRELPGERYYQYCTAIPVGTLLAQTWNRALIREVGAMIGTEMEYFGVTLWLAPGMNIHRNPLCGRNFEYYSEDPYVAGTIAAAMTEGVQSNYGCGTTIKHFACNNQEDNRMGSDSVISERTLREVYLKGFEIAVRESQPLSIMTSYNLINGVHAANNYDLCTETARNEWGFKGMIMTDWTTTEVDEKCTASGCMRAGNDLVMPGCFGDHDNMHKELAEGTLKIEDLKACIARLVSVIWKSNQYLQ